MARSGGIYEVGRHILNDSGKPVRLIGLGMDISQRKEAEELLRLHAAMFDNVAAGIYLVRAADGIILSANDQFYRIFGYTTGEIVGRHFSMLNARFWIFFRGRSKSHSRRDQDNGQMAGGSAEHPQGQFHFLDLYLQPQI